MRMNSDEKYREKLNTIISDLKERYSAGPVDKLNNVVEDNPDLPISAMTPWIKKFYGKTTKQFPYR